jgi:hypothetical protein
LIVYRLGGLHINAGKIFIFDDDKLALFVFIPLYNLIPRHFLAVGFRYALVIDRTFEEAGSSILHAGSLGTARPEWLPNRN